MIFFALLVFALLNRFPQWILKEKFKLAKDNFSWKTPLLKLSGLCCSILLFILLICTVSITSKKTFLENKNAIYGLEFNKTMKELGFQDRMKISFVNGKTIHRVSDLVPTILMENGEVLVSVEMNNIQKKISISEQDKIALMESPVPLSVTAIKFDKNGKNKIKYTSENFGFSSTYDRFKKLLKEAYYLINPEAHLFVKQTGGFISIGGTHTFNGYLIVFSFNLLLIILLNFIPLAGLSLGNFALSVCETLRKKHFNKKKILIIQWVCIIITIFIIFINIIR